MSTLPTLPGPSASVTWPPCSGSITRRSARAVPLRASGGGLTRIGAVQGYREVVGGVQVEEGREVGIHVPEEIVLQEANAPPVLQKCACQSRHLQPISRDQPLREGRARRPVDRVEHLERAIGPSRDEQIV